MSRRGIDLLCDLRTRRLVDQGLVDVPNDGVEVVQGGEVLPLALQFAYSSVIVFSRSASS
jgi:hypothetical protein